MEVERDAKLMWASLDDIEAHFSRYSAFLKPESDPYHNNEAQVGAVNVPVPSDFRDLSLDHCPLGVLTAETIHDQQVWHKYHLTSSQVDQFWEYGYLSNVPALSDEQCEKLLVEYQTFLNADTLHAGHGLFYEFHRNQSGSPDSVLLHALGQWRISQAFHDVCFLPSIAIPAAQLIHESKEPTPLRLWHDQLFAKPPRYGGVVSWHQDYSYWTRTKPMCHITVHIALDDQTVESGGLHFVSGSHRWHRDGMPLPITDVKFGDMESVFSVLSEEEKAMFKPVPSGLKRGEASFHHPLTVHGSFANRSEGPRRSTVVNYFADGVYSDSDQPMMNGVPPIRKGDKMTGQFFPLIFDPCWMQRS